MQSPSAAPASRLLFLDALRAFASVVILWHHFALYPPLCVQATPILGSLVHWFNEYARSTQVFFVVGGYVMARTMSGRAWDSQAVWKFLARRYCRLGIPYLAAIMLAIAACSFGHGWLPEAVVGGAPTFPQVLAHVFFLQEQLGFEHLSAGIWFVCINFQLGIIHVTALWLRDALARWLKHSAASPWIDVPMIAGWLISIFSLFHYQDQSGADAWAPYFYPYFFLGVIIHRATTKRRAEVMFWVYLAVMVAAMCHDWRWRLASALVVGLLLFLADKTGFATRWPQSRWVSRLGRVSYSLFLVHFPVLVIVSSVWARLGWTSPAAAVAGLFAAFAASVGAAFAFHRWVEEPSAALSRRWGSSWQDTPAAAKRLPADVG
jgi:peptidoglycan/LPS O-acetylase OafA/YrhL